MSLTAIAPPPPVDPVVTAVTMIEAVDLVKVFGGHRAVAGVSFAVSCGEVMGFLGPNGAGKTTTMRMLAGYTPATSGRAAIAGHDIARDSFRARAALGYLPESAPLYNEMGVRDYLAFMAEIKRIERERRKKAVGQAIEECGLAEVARRTIGNLSKGFRQRVSLAQAVLGDPPVLILDEPTVGLDPRQIIEVRQMIKDMGGRRTVLLSTHILPEVSMTCGKVVVIDRGRLVASGTPEKLVSTVRVENPIHVAIEGDAQLAESVLMQTPGVRRVRRDRWISARRISFEVTPGAETDPRAEIARRIVEAGLRLIELSSPGGSLEDVFLQVISASEGG